MEQQPQSVGQTQNVPEKKVWYKRWWVIGIGILILYSIGSNALNDTQKRVTEDLKTPQVADNKQAEKTTESAPAVPNVIVTSANISKEYSENEVAADAKYKGKTIEMSGKVTSIDNGISDNEMIVRLSDGQYDINNAWCYMNEGERDKVLALKKGQQVTLIGTGDSATLKSPVLKSCTVK